MTIKKKASKSHDTPIEDAIGEVIGRGGKTAYDDDNLHIKQEEKEVRFTLRIPCELIHKIDHMRKNRVGNVSRNQWILEAINNAVK